MPQEYKAQGEGFDIYFTWFGDYLLARVEGPHDSLAITVGYWTQVVAECKRRGAQRLLVLENLLKESMDGHSSQEIFDAIYTLGFDGVKIAFVDRNEVRWAEQEHISLLAREHGIVARMFTQQRDAVTWLRHGIE